MIEVATLGRQQRIFTYFVGKQIEWLYSNGYEATFGDAYRDPRVFGEIGENLGYGRSASNHKRRLAMDLNLFKDGKYLKETSDHRESGLHWETLHAACAWGGHFNDGNHYSMKYFGCR